MPIATLIALLLQYLPTIINDVEAVDSVLSTASTAVTNAKTNGGVIAQADWDALDAKVNGDLAALAAAASTTVPAAAT